MSCPTCGAQAEASARFCSNCGSEIRHLSDERRVVTVLFGDLVGFTSLSETRDPETVKNLVDRCFARLATDITAFGGTVDKVIGDAIVALFGAPVAHEDDAERGVRAALRMQQTLAGFVSEVAGAELRMRIGVTTGEVLVGALRAGGDYTAMGDVVNTASRLQTAAQPGEVLVGGSTHAVTQQVIDFEARPPLQAKGREAPVEVWAATGTLAPPGSRPRQYSVPLVGRDREIGLLEGALQSSMTNRRATSILLVGDAGLGKTRLASELAARTVAEGGAVLEGRCLPYGEANAWWPVAEAIRRSCWVEAGDQFEAARARTRERVLTALGDTADAEERERVVTGLLHLMEFEQALVDVDPANARDEAIRSLVAYIEGFARQFPILIVFSDLHWADDVVLELTDTLLDRLGRSPVTLLGTAREQLLDRWSPKPGRYNAVRLYLDPLGPEAAADLLTALLGHEPTPELARVMLERSGGNPFFIEELVSLMADATDEGATSMPILPDTLRGLVAARLDGLSVDQRTILQDAAVLGPRGEVRDLQTMATEMHQQVDVDRVLGSLVADDLFELDLDHWSFRSDLVREVAYGTLTKTDRAKRHEGIARYIESHMGSHPSDNTIDRLANHYGVAAQLTGELEGRIGDDLRTRALHWLGKAAARASESEALPLADRLFSQAIDLVGEDPDGERCALLLGRASARTGAWDLEGAELDARRVRADAAEAGDEVQEACAVVRLGEIAQKAGRLTDALELLGDAVARFQRLGDDAGLAEALRLLGMTQLFSGDLPAAETSVRSAQHVFQALADRQGQGWALQNLAWIAFVQGQLDEADQRLQKAVAAFTEVGDNVGRSWALGLLGFVRMQQGRVEDAEAIAVPILDDARERDDKWAIGIMTTLLASLRLWAGRTDEAVDLGEQAVAVFEGLRDGYGLSQAVGACGRAMVMAGRVDEGVELLDRFGQLLAELQGAEAAHMITAIKIIIAVQIGDAAAGRRWARDLDVGADEAAAQLNVTTLRLARGMVALQSGDRQRAAGALGMGEGEPPADPVESPESGGPCALVLAASGRVEEAEAIARATFDSSRATYLDLAMAEVAVALIRAGVDGDDACEWGERARERVDATQDRVAQLVVRLAVDLVCDTVGDRLGRAGSTGAEIDRLRRQLGIEAVGWSTAFETVLRGAAPAVLA